jgi:hemoglobin
MTTIYEAIGGGDAVSAAVDQFYHRVLADPCLAPYFDGVDVAEIKRHQRAFIAAAVGGPEVYRGRSMTDAHAHLNVTPDDFDTVVDHLVATLASLGVPEAAINEIGGRLAPLKSDVVTA